MTLHDQVIEIMVAAKIVERLLDRYYFEEDKVAFSNILQEDGFRVIDRGIKEDLSAIQPEELARLLGTIHRSINRHTVRGRQDIEFIHEYVGLRIGKGTRLIKSFS